jgi:hypothetical protein
MGYLVCILLILVQVTKALVPNLINYGYLSLKTRNAQIFRLKDISDKLGYDAESGQLYEQRMDERIDEAFVLTDEKTGEKIFLTKEEKGR